MQRIGRNTTLAGVLTLAFLVLVTGAAAAAPPPSAPAPGTTLTIALEGIQCGSCLFRLQKEAVKVEAISDFKGALRPPHATLVLDETRMDAASLVNTLAEILTRVEPGVKTGASLAVQVDQAAGTSQNAAAAARVIQAMLKGIKGVREAVVRQDAPVALIQFEPGARVTSADIARALSSGPVKYTPLFAGVRGFAR
jgi:hypothetical protein